MIRKYCCKHKVWRRAWVCVCLQVDRLFSTLFFFLLLYQLILIPLKWDRSCTWSCKSLASVDITITEFPQRIFFQAFTYGTLQWMCYHLVKLLKIILKKSIVILMMPSYTHSVCKLPSTRLLTCFKTFDHIRLALSFLHWISVFQIYLKNVLITFKVLYELAHLYLSAILHVLLQFYGWNYWHTSSQVSQQTFLKHFKRLIFLIVIFYCFMLSISVFFMTKLLHQCTQFNRGYINKFELYL